MHNIPWFSTFTLVGEIFVTSALLYVIYQGYFKNIFHFWLTAIVLGYEIIINISYMTYRMFSHVDNAASPDSPIHIAVAAFHGIFSLLMFILLLVFLFFAWKNYRIGVNFFHARKKLTIAFLIAWLIAVASGFLFYYMAYFSPEEKEVQNIATQVQ